MSSLLNEFEAMHNQLKVVKNEFFDIVTAKLAYFGATAPQVSDLTMPDRTQFDRALCRRLAVAGLLVQYLHNDPNFGRTKLAKLFYLANVHGRLELQTEYYREAAGPLDQRALYNERVGIEALAHKYRLFDAVQKGRMVRYKPASNCGKILSFAARHLGPQVEDVIAMARAFDGLDTDQSEIVATLYACWNDFLIRKRWPTDDEITTEFLLHWHSQKSRFSRARLGKALAWMRDHGLVPRGTGKLTNTKPASDFADS